MAKENTLQGLLINKLKMILDIEEQIIDALPIMAESATDNELKEAFEEHLEQTISQAKRVRSCLEEFGEEAESKKTHAIRGLVKDAEWIMSNVEKGPALDAALIADAQSVEHAEIASYGTAIEWAELIGHHAAADLLQEILDEEKAADEKLNTLAKNRINPTVELNGYEEEEE